MIAFGTGGLTGHSAIAVWETDSTGARTLYVCESTDKNPLGPVYFPPPVRPARCCHRPCVLRSLSGLFQLTACASPSIHLLLSPLPLPAMYLPLQYGLRRTVFSTWITLAQAAMYHVALLPIAPASAAAFNETAYWQWFYTVQGMPYGYHTMLMS